MIPASYPALTADGYTVAEHALTFDAGRAWRLLIVPALFDKANRLRRMAVEVMRRLDAAGIDSFLIDLPGCNESLQPLDAQTPTLWREAATLAAAHFRATHVLGMRGGALLIPAGLPGWRYAPTGGAQILRQMLRTRIMAAREAGVEETLEALMEAGLAHGLDLSGHRLSAAFLREFQALKPAVSPQVSDIDQDVLGSGGGLWLRAEPGESREQADALAAIVAIGMKAS